MQKIFVGLRISAVALFYPLFAHRSRGCLAVLISMMLVKNLSAASTTETFAGQVDRLKTSGQIGTPETQQFLKQAEKLAVEPIWVRSYSEEDMKKGVVGGRRYLEAIGKIDSLRKRRPALAVTFGLASSDVSGCREIMNEVPLMAAVYRLNGSAAVLRRLIAQLEEVTTWDPFQRPGWTSSAMAEEELPPEGDGVWLATGTLIQAICIALDILPPDALPAELRAKLERALERELRYVESDWMSRKPWYVRQEKSESNQWIVPASGLVIACAYLGRDRFPEAYAMGVKALEQSLASAGDDGSMSEGYTYALSWSSGSLLLADRFMRMAGDNHFSDRSFFRNFPAWAALCYQPGGYVVTAFDGYGFQRQHGAREIRPAMCRTAAVTNNEGLYWILGHVGGGASKDFFGLLSIGGIMRAAIPPATSGLFEKSRMFIWRSSWKAGATGLWVRGGDRADFHDHWDRGHVNFIVRGKPVLIEAGTPGYADTRKKSEFDSVAGHNVLQVDDNALPLKNQAPIEVLENTSERGALSVEAGASYPELSSWKRTVRWTIGDLHISDRVVTSEGTPHKLLFRWHLGSAENAVVSGDGKHFTVTVSEGKLTFPGSIGDAESDAADPSGPDTVETTGIRLEFTSDIPVKVVQVKRPDHIFKFRNPGNLHTTIEVSPLEPAGRWNLETIVSAE